MLSVLPDLTFPITIKQLDPLYSGLVQLNVIDAGIDIQRQKALGILFDTYEILAKTGVNYTGLDGHRRLFEDAQTFLGGSSVATRHGDLRAAHLAIDFNNAQKRLQKAGLPLLPADVGELLRLCSDLATIPSQTDDRLGVLIRMLQKR